MIKCNVNVRIDTEFGPKELNKRQWYLPIIQKEPSTSRTYSRAAQDGINCKETP
jgi:hypothetical protein